MFTENNTHVSDCETDLANDTGAPTISPRKKKFEDYNLIS